MTLLDDLRAADAAHCIYQCGPDGSLNDCAAMGLPPCGGCVMRNALPKLLAVVEAAKALDRVATWGALNRPEVAPLRAALAALEETPSRSLTPAESLFAERLRSGKVAP